jgi:hypothetical protein
MSDGGLMDTKHGLFKAASGWGYFQLQVQALLRPRTRTTEYRPTVRSTTDLWVMYPGTNQTPYGTGVPPQWQNKVHYMPLGWHPIEYRPPYHFLVGADALHMSWRGNRATRVLRVHVCTIRLDFIKTGLG